MSIIKAKRFPYESFIFGWYLPEKFCDDVLKWHKHNTDLSKKGVCLDKNGKSGKNDSYKKSTDKASGLSIGDQKMIEIAKALADIMQKI